MSLFSFLPKFPRMSTSPSHREDPTPPPGITQINESVWQFQKGDDIPEVVIIFFHGLQLSDFDNAFWKTWLSRRDDNVVWPKDWLGVEFPNARILTVSYDSSDTKDCGKLDMHNLGENLVNDIINDAEDIGQKCPVILVGHSLGGIVIKQFINSSVHSRSVATNQEDRDRISTFLGNVKGMFYYGTPHQGTVIADLAGGIPGTNPILLLLKTLSTERARINEDFRKTRANLNAKAFAIAEGLPTQYKFFNGIVVEEASARYDDDRYYTATRANHFNVCKPENTNTAIFTHLRGFIVSIVDENLQKRLDALQKFQGWSSIEAHRAVQEQFVSH